MGERRFDGERGKTTTIFGTSAKESSVNEPGRDAGTVKTKTKEI